MSELDIIKETPSPRTRASLAHDLRQLGVLPGMTLIIHSSLRSLGWVCGGSVTVVHALMDVVTKDGTIVVPTQTDGLSDPEKWENPPVPQEWWQVIYDAMPVFDPQTTPSYGMGQIVETFRTWPGVVRSHHPHVSFAAWGRHAHFITEGHTLENSLGEGSPLARIYDLDGWVLLVGVGYDSCTSFHLAEYRAPGAKEEILGAPMLENGQHVWKRYRDIEINAAIFPKIGIDFEQTGLVKIAKVGSATTRLFSQRQGVDFAVGWLTWERSQER
ncbi:MAG TPA: AAC(3) family N-acetyltransferase [Ktedonobacteraceae bacterium]|nr:AAC(3) family N-acetyltransferase [Ktedonobacteraceae bacterium]